MADAYEGPGRTGEATVEGSRGDATVVESEPAGAAAVELIHATSVELWVVTVLFFVGGDLVTTAVGLMRGGVAEVGPLVAPLIMEYGLLVMFPMKLLAVGVCFVLWRLTPKPHAVGVPLGLAVFGVLVTGWNVGVILASLLPA